MGGKARARASRCIQVDGRKNCTVVERARAAVAPAIAPLDALG
jgi:hypothetical protein